MKFDFKKFFTILSAVAPGILVVVPGGAALIPVTSAIIGAIAHAEANVKGGAAKKAFVLEAVKDAADVANAIKPGTLDQAQIADAAGHAVDAIVTTINVIQSVKAAVAPRSEQKS